MNELPSIEEAPKIVPSEGLWAVALMLCTDTLPGSKFTLTLRTVIAVDPHEAQNKAYAEYIEEGGRGAIADWSVMRLPGH